MKHMVFDIKFHTKNRVSNPFALSFSIIIFSRHKNG